MMLGFACLMLRRPTRSTRTDTLFPYTTLFRSIRVLGEHVSFIGHAAPYNATAALLRIDLTYDPNGLPDRSRSARPWPLAHHDLKPLQFVGQGRDAHKIHRRRRGKLRKRPVRSEEHTSELQSLMRISYAVFCLKKKKHI